jgi:hypothetical protein
MPHKKSHKNKGKSKISYPPLDDSHTKPSQEAAGSPTIEILRPNPVAASDFPTLSSQSREPEQLRDAEDATVPGIERLSTDFHHYLLDLLKQARGTPVAEPSFWDKTKTTISNVLWRNQVEVDKTLITILFTTYAYQARYQSKEATWFMLGPEIINSVSMCREWQKAKQSHTAANQEYKKLLPPYQKKVKKGKAEKKNLEELTKELLAHQKQFYYKQCISAYDESFHHEEKVRKIMLAGFIGLTLLEIAAISIIASADNDKEEAKSGPAAFLLAFGLIGIVANFFNTVVNASEIYKTWQTKAVADMKDTVTALNLESDLSEGSLNRSKIIEYGQKSGQTAEVIIERIDEEIARKEKVVAEITEDLKNAADNAVASVKERKSNVVTREMQAFKSKILDLWKIEPDLFKRVIINISSEKKNDKNFHEAIYDLQNGGELSLNESTKEINEAWSDWAPLEEV